MEKGNVISNERDKKMTPASFLFLYTLFQNRDCTWAMHQRPKTVEEDEEKKKSKLIIVRALSYS